MSPNSTSPQTLRLGIRFALCRFRSPLLTASLLVSFPPPTKMFQSGGFPIPNGTAMGLPWQEVLFGDLRFKGSLRLPGAYRSLARPSSAPEPSNPPNGVTLAQFNVEPVWTVSSRGLNTSLPWCVHPGPIKRVFYSCPMMPRLGVGFMLRCFQHLSLTAWLPGVALSDNRYTRGCRPLFLSY